MGKKEIYTWTKMILVLVMAMVFSRVFFLTTVMGDHFGDLAHGNMIRKEKLDPIRGVITDRFGKPLAMNIDYLGRTIRYYPGGETISAIVGYLGKPSQGDLKDCAQCNPVMTLGKAGLEKSYQNDLVGFPGEAVIQETADGKTRKVITQIESAPGKNLKTNIDLELQKQVFLALKNKYKEEGKSGAMIVAKVNGEVLALASVPSFDPNLFIANGKRSDFGGDYKDIESLLIDEKGKPLFNRAISGDFAPGSVYKLVPAMGALEEGKINRETEILDTGEIKIGLYRFGNWYLDQFGKTEGEVNVIKAISRSNDIFFYKMGEALGADSLISWTKRFGLGEKTGIDLPGESGGFVPTPYWREKTLGEKWFLGNTYHMAIGQGDLMTTPIQINRMTAQAVSGMSCDPMIVGSVACGDQKFNPKNIATILEGMKGACSPGGTAPALFEYAGRIYCKTGTAQVGSKETLSNAWISVVIPKGQDVREWIVITVLVEEGGQGSAVAAPVAKEIMPYLMKI